MRWGEITALQPLIYRAGTLHHAACATPEAAGAFQNSLYWVLQHSLRQSWSLNFISFMQAVMNETEVYCISGWFSILRQSIHLSITFKLFTSDEQLRCKLHLTRHAKPFFPLHENNCELIWIFFLIIIQKWHNWHQSDPEPGSQSLVYATRTCLLCCYFVNVFLSTSSNFTFLKAERPIYAKKQQQRCVSNS